MPLQPLVVLIGPPGAGKSRIGRKLAKYLEVELFDTDSAIVDRHGPIAEFFAERGEPAFRAVERDVVAEALSSDAVVSLGGGAVMDPSTREALKHHRVVLLTVTPDAVAERISGKRRPLLAAETAEEKLAAWTRLAESRRAVYESLATRSWDTSVRPITAIAREIADWVTTEMAGTAQQ